MKKTLGCHFLDFLKGTFGFGCKGWGWGTIVSILLLGSKEVLLLGSAQCFKKSMMDQSIWLLLLLLKRKKL
jgi:hypothetical protein